MTAEDLPLAHQGPRSTDVVYLSLRGIRFSVSSEILGLFPDSVLLSLFPSGLIAFFPAPHHYHHRPPPFHFCSQLRTPDMPSTWTLNEDEMDGRKDADGSWLSQVEEFKIVNVDMDPHLFQYLITAFRDFLVGNAEARKEGILETPSTKEDSETSIPSVTCATEELSTPEKPTKTPDVPEFVDTVLVLREEMEYFVINPSASCDVRRRYSASTEEAREKSSKGWKKVMGKFRRMIPKRRKIKEGAEVGDRKEEEKKDGVNDSADTLDEVTGEALCLDGVGDGLDVDDISLRSESSTKSQAPGSLRRRCGEHLSSTSLVSSMYGESAHSVRQGDVSSTHTPTSFDDGVEAEQTEQTLQREHLVDAVELLSDFGRGETCWGHRSYDPSKSKIVSVALMKAKPVAVGNVPDVVKEVKGEEEEVDGRVEGLITQVDDPDEAAANLSVPGLEQHLAARMPTVKGLGDVGGKGKRRRKGFEEEELEGWERVW
ncbi:hypothetical protein BC829DRAFT_415582 [Chytridium lagenaria]|nr:hypothetical protein BC829DRAFT_415582 [Chytridium lagenaria]